MQKSFAEKYNAFETNKGNIIWCGAMCIAWKDFLDVNTKKPLILRTQSEAALKQIENFNHSLFNYHDIDDKNVYLKTGNGKETQTLINRQVRKKFINYSFPDLSFKLLPSDIISFAYIFKKLDFACKFEKKSNGFLFNGVAVKAFQAVGQAQKKQIKVFQYKSRDNFCIRINDRLTNDSLYLIKNSKISTVDKATEVAIKAQQKEGDLLSKKDLFQMPVIDLSVIHEYKQLIGLAFENQQLKGYNIVAICQALKVKVDETGALIENRAVIYCTKGPSIKKQQPRQFILDKTFWLVMKETKKHPYLCIQVRNPIEAQFNQ